MSTPVACPRPGAPLCKLGPGTRQYVAYPLSYRRVEELTREFPG
jgi:hypothetical protein